MSQYYIDAAYCYRQSSVVLSVCWSLVIVTRTKTAEIDRDAVWVADLGGSKEACIRWCAHWRHLANTTTQSQLYVRQQCGLIMVTLCNRADHYIFAL